MLHEHETALFTEIKIREVFTKLEIPAAIHTAQKLSRNFKCHEMAQFTVLIELINNTNSYMLVLFCFLIIMPVVIHCSGVNQWLKIMNNIKVYTELS